MTSQPMPYETLRTVQVALTHIIPGDTLSLSLRNEEKDLGIYVLAERVRDLFLGTFGFFPTRVRIHPDHLAILEKQGRGKSLEVTIPEKTASVLRGRVDLTTFPTSIPFLGDSDLDLFTAMGSYSFRVEDTPTMAVDALTYILTNPW